MTRDEFKAGYGDLMAVYGKKDKRHFDVWFRIFGELDPAEWAKRVDEVIAQHSDNWWPTPGQFNELSAPEPPITFIDPVELAEKRRRRMAGEDIV